MALRRWPGYASKRLKAPTRSGMRLCCELDCLRGSSFGTLSARGFGGFDLRYSANHALFEIGDGGDRLTRIVCILDEVERCSQDFRQVYGNLIGHLFSI